MAAVAAISAAAAGGLISKLMFISQPAGCEGQDEQKRPHLARFRSFSENAKRADN